MPKVSFHDSDDNSLESANPGMIFVGSQLVSTSQASPRVGGVAAIAGARSAKVNTAQPAWLPRTVSGDSMGQFINPFK